ncbi:caspase-8 [Epargyreus clarus]|uniref:caspase-8 n=1 Tax=Epargyreus clarus TaxID=520877 RepID=UPI003C2F369C
MLRSDAQGHGVSNKNNVLTNINSITTEIMLDIQRDLEPYDVVSMVFLLYEVPDTALQRLTTYQRVFRDVETNNLNLLYEWALYAQSKPTWRYEFLEALTICRLYNIIKKLGFNVSSVKQHYQPDNVYVNVHIHPIKKQLYILCENITSDTLSKLKDTLLSYQIDTTEHEYCEMIFLELMSQKFIVLNTTNKEGILSNIKRTDVESLATIIERYHDLKIYATQLREIERKLNNETPFPLPEITSTPSVSKPKIDDAKQSNKDKMYAEDMQDTIELFGQINFEDIPIKNLKSDTSQTIENRYPIYNPKRVGVCCIINQERFHPSKSSIQCPDEVNELSDRLGSRSDQAILEETMTNLNFIVKVERNLKYNGIFEFIKKCIQISIPEDSIFILCILSHGVRGHIYSSDSLKVNVEDLQKILDSDEALHLRGKPKVLILQACRIDETPNVPRPRLVADSTASNYYLRKSHFLIYWATAPEYEAFRDEKLGSIFIQTLCYVLKKTAAHEQLSDICTTVTDYVTNYCTKKQYVQVPIFESSLRKKLYLCIPNADNSKK